MVLAVAIGFALAPCLTAIEWIRVIALGIFLWIVYSVLTRV